MPNIKSAGLTNEYKAHRLKRIIYMREIADPPVVWYVIARRLKLNVKTVKRFYSEVKSEAVK